jgi:hypothetical protein
MFEYIKTLSDKALIEMSRGDSTVPATARVNRAAIEALAELERREDEAGWEATAAAERGYESWLENGAGNWLLQAEADADLRLHEALWPNGYGR